MIENILFDLDGTLTDPFEGITNSVIYALKKFGITEADKAKLKCFFGPPLYQSFISFYNFKLDDAYKAVEYYREYFSVKGIYENRVYSGIENVLAELKKMGYRLIVATSKPQVFAEEILRHFNLAQYFDCVSGATLDSSRVEKSDIITYALKSFKVLPQSAIMVGDRKHDIIGARKNLLKSIGVLYGYGDEAELKSAGADFIASSPQDILNVICSLSI